jgi:hypothetical protein
MLISIKYQLILKSIPELLQQFRNTGELKGFIILYFHFEINDFRIKNGCNPLINEPTDIMLQNATDESDHSQDKERKKPKCRRQPVASIYDVIPYPQLKREFEGVRSLRLNLEKV